MTEDELMLTSVLKCSRHELYSKESVLTKDQQAHLDKMKQEKLKGEPVQYVIGSTEFYGSEFDIDKRALIPRPETEILVDLLVAKAKETIKKELRVLDIGTGSGVIAISIAKNIIGARVDAIDVSSDAISLAKDNAAKNFVEQKIFFYEKDVFTFLKEAYINGEKYDIIVSNPPYIKTSDLDSLPDEVKREPVLALDGGADGLRFYREIIKSSRDLLNDNGMLFFEIGDGQRAGIDEIFSRNEGFKDITFEKDYVGTERIVFATKYAS